MLYVPSRAVADVSAGRSDCAPSAARSFGGSFSQSPSAIKNSIAASTSPERSCKTCGREQIFLKRTVLELRKAFQSGRVLRQNLVTLFHRALPPPIWPRHRKSFGGKAGRSIERANSDRRLSGVLGPATLRASPWLWLANPSAENGSGETLDQFDSSPALAKEPWPPSYTLQRI